MKCNANGPFARPISQILRFERDKYSTTSPLDYEYSKRPQAFARSLYRPHTYAYHTSNGLSVTKIPDAQCLRANRHKKYRISDGLRERVEYRYQWTRSLHTSKSKTQNTKCGPRGLLQKPSSSSLPKTLPTALKITGSIGPRLPRKGSLAASIARKNEGVTLRRAALETPEEERKRLIEDRRRLIEKHKFYEENIVMPIYHLERRVEMSSYMIQELWSSIPKTLRNARQDGKIAYLLDQFQRSVIIPLADRLLESKRLINECQDVIAAIQHDIDHRAEQRRQELERKQLKEEEEARRNAVAHLMATRTMRQRAEYVIEQIENLKGKSGPHIHQVVLFSRLCDKADEVAACLNADTLHDIKQELVDRGKWKTDMKTHLEPQSKEQPIDGAFFQGAKSPETMQALFSLFWAGPEMIENAYEAAGIAHDWRSINLNRMLLDYFPGVFEYRVRYAKLQTLLNTLSSENSPVKTLLWVIAWMRQSRRQISENIFYNRVREMCDISQLWTTRLQDIRDCIEEVYCTGLHPSLLNVDNPRARAQMSRLRLIVQHQIRTISLVAEISSMQRVRSLDEGRRQGQLGSTRRLSKLLNDAVNEITSTIRSLWDGVSAYSIWSAVTDLCVSLPLPRPMFEEEIRLLSTIRNQNEHDSNLAPVNTKFRFDPCPWLEHSFMYPAKGALPMYVVFSPRSMFTEISKLRSSKLLGIDAHITNCVGRPGTLRKPRLHILTLVSDDRIVIIHVNRLLPIELRGIASMADLLQNSSIRKVGFGLDLLKDTLAQEHNLDLINDLDLAKQQGLTVVLGRQLDPDYETLSELSEQAFDSPLPTMADSSDMNNFGIENPMNYHHVLASRAYGALKLYQKLFNSTIVGTVAATTGRNGTGELETTNELGRSASIPRAFGPIHVDVLWQSPKSWYATFDGRYQSSVMNSRGKYLRALISKMASQFLRQRLLERDSRSVGARASSHRRQNSVIRDLQAYFLFTTFAEPIEYIQHLLVLNNPAANILTVADTYDLPLHPWDRSFLETQNEARQGL